MVGTMKSARDPACSGMGPSYPRDAPVNSSFVLEVGHPAPYTDRVIAPRRFSRFRIAVFATIERICVLLGGRHFYRWRYLSPKRLGVRDIELPIPAGAAALDGLVIAHLSDIHAGPFLAKGDLGAVVDLIEQRRPDVVCWTGDYVTHGIHNVQPVIPELRRCVGKLGTFAVFGNHDYKKRREWEMTAALEPDGWTFLRNSSHQLEVNGGTVAFAGIEDPEEGKVVDVAAAMAEARSADLVIALSHGPRGAPAFAEYGVAAVLSGHTHGSQVDLPFLRDLGPAHPGLRIELGSTTVLVSRGLGVVGMPLRTGVPAEVSFVTLRAAAKLS